MIVVTFRHLDGDHSEHKRSRELTPMEIARGSRSWGNAVRRLYRKEWANRYGPGYHHAQIQDDRGLHVTVLAEYGERS